MKAKYWHRHYDYNVPRTVDYPRFPIQMILHIAAVKFPHKTAMNMYNTKYTCAEIWWKTIRLANALAKLGVRQGDRIGLAMPNCPQYIIAYYAILCLGCVVVNINPFSSKPQFRNILNHTEVKALISVDSTLPVLRSLMKEIDLQCIIVTKLTDFMKEFETSSAMTLDLEKGWHHFSGLIDASNDVKLPHVSIHPLDPAMIQYTKGTTGDPKAVVLSHQNIVVSTIQFSLWCRPLIDSTPVEQRSLIAALPYCQVNGNIIGMNWSLFNGVTQVLFPHFDAHEFFEAAVKLENATVLPASPSMIAKIIHQPEEYGLYKGMAVQWIHSMGAPMPAELSENLRARGLFYTEGWGMSETTAMGICNPVLGSKPGSIGLPMMDNDVRLMDLNEGKIITKADRTGEIILKSPSVMHGGYNISETMMNNHIQGGWFCTGDIARTDEEGYFYIVDRKEDVITFNGLHVYPREVDKVLCTHPLIEEAMTIGVSDDAHGKKLKALVVLHPGDRASDTEIIDFCSLKLSSHEVPQEIEFQDHLPKTSDGETLRKMLREQEAAKRNLIWSSKNGHSVKLLLPP